MTKLVLVRHGESTWNKENRFTGWTDVDLSDKGRQEARRRRGAEGRGLCLRRGVHFRAEARHPHALERPGRNGPDVDSGPPLLAANERHYGALQGLNKAETAAKFGEQQVKIWRRSYDVPPPALTPDDERYPGHDPRYGLQPAGTAPHRMSEGYGGALPAAMARDHCPGDPRGQKVLIAAHGNSLRALVKYLDNIPEQEIVELNIPTGMPLVYELDDNLKPLNRYYLGDPEKVKAAMDAVAAQGKKK